MRFTATGIGSLPNALAARERGIDPRVTAGITREFFTDLPYLVELPQRGAGADMIGRTAWLLATLSDDFAVSTVPTGWRRSSAQGADMERAAAWWQQDLDAIAEVYADYSGAFKVQLCGPLTFCSAIEDSRGEPALRDPGFIRDVVAAFTEAARAHIHRIRLLVPGISRIIVQLDEPALHAITTGDIPTASGYSRVRSIPHIEAAALLKTCVTNIAAGMTADDQPPVHHTEVWLHDCGPEPHLGLDVMGEAGFDALTFDIGKLRREHIDGCGHAIDAGRRLVLGVVGPDDWDGSVSTLRERALQRSETLRQRLAIGEEQWADCVTLSPSCGLAGAHVGQARAVIKAISAAGASLAGDTIPSAE